MNSDIKIYVLAFTASSVHEFEKLSNFYLESQPKKVKFFQFIEFKVVKWDVANSYYGALLIYSGIKKT